MDLTGFMLEMSLLNLIESHEDALTMPADSLVGVLLAQVYNKK